MKFDGVQEPEVVYKPKHYVCMKTTEKACINGIVDKPFWEKAHWSDDFEDIEGDKKPRPPKRTRVKMLWDDEYLYFGAELEDDQIWANLTERESIIFLDNDFEIFIDPDGDTHNYYEFEMNALNTIWDLMLTQPYRDNGKPVNGFDIRGIKTAVHINGELNNPSADNKSWSLEVAMPWKILKECAKDSRKPEVGDNWRINFSRVEWKTEVKDGKYVKCINPETGKPYPEDNWVWSPIGIVNMHYPELWGYVVFEDKDVDFAIDDDEIIKWELRKLFYRQRNYYEKNGEYCKNLELLRQGDEFKITPKIEVTKSLFQISALSSDKKSIISVREDGLVWIE